jgi:hypothetical protein
MSSNSNHCDSTMGHPPNCQCSEHSEEMRLDRQAQVIRDLYNRIEITLMSNKLVEEENRVATVPSYIEDVHDSLLDEMRNNRGEEDHFVKTLEDILNEYKQIKEDYEAFCQAYHEIVATQQSQVERAKQCRWSLTESLRNERDLALYALATGSKVKRPTPTAEEIMLRASACGVRFVKPATIQNALDTVTKETKNEG